MIAKSTKEKYGYAGNASSQDIQSKPISCIPFLMRFLSPQYTGQRDAGKTIYTYVKRETTDDR